MAWHHEDPDPTQLVADVDTELADWWDGFVWEPIANYDRSLGLIELLRNGRDCAVGYWGVRSAWLRDANEPADVTPIWRHAQESMGDWPLLFNPTEFAALNAEARKHLIAD